MISSKLLEYRHAYNDANRQRRNAVKLLKVLTNEKRGGLRVISFNRSPFKLFSRKFSKESVKAPSCDRPRTAPRTLFVSFANNNCFQTAVLRRSFMKKIRETCMPRGEFKYRYWFFADTPNVAWIVSVI
jgi:hypothetical protein